MTIMTEHTAPLTDYDMPETITETYYENRDVVPKTPLKVVKENSSSSSSSSSSSTSTNSPSLPGFDRMLARRKNLDAQYSQDRTSPMFNSHSSPEPKEESYHHDETLTYYDSHRGEQPAYKEAESPTYDVVPDFLKKEKSSSSSR